MRAQLLHIIIRPQHSQSLILAILVCVQRYLRVVFNLHFPE